MKTEKKHGFFDFLKPLVSKKAIYFTLDALFAAILIGLAIMVSTKYFITETTQPQVNYYSGDIINCLSNIKISEVNNSYVKSLIAKGDIINLDNSLIEQIGEFYVLNNTELARNLSILVSNDLLPDKFGFEVLVNDEPIYSNSSERSNSEEIVSTRRLISGIEKFKPLKGATSKVFLEGITSKKYSSYVYFGGFVGQGNLSTFIDDIPSNVTISDIYLEVDSGSDFTFYINNDQCGSTFPAGPGSMASDGWDMNSCNSLIVPGAKNKFNIYFSGDISSAYIGGGYIRVDYFTDEMLQEETVTSLTENLPGITGIVNLYSSFYVPGDLNNISVFLHYYINTTNSTNNTFYFSIGNSTIFKDNNLSGNKNKTLNVGNVTALMSLASLSSKTIPIRVGFENVSFGYIFEGSANVVLITDLSGSMDDQMGSTSTGTKRNCDNPSLNSSTTARLSVAKCLDKEFVIDIINISGNRVGLITFSDSTKASDTTPPTTDVAALTTKIGNATPETGFNASGSTCICCGINSARNLLIANFSNITLIAKGSNWLYNNLSLSGNILPDSNGYLWYDFSYDDSGWKNGTAILGYTSNVYTPTVTKDIGSNLNGQSYYANLWENAGDVAGPPNDFTSGILNHTGANSYGMSGSNNGWDYDPRNGSGVFGNDDDIDYNNISGGRLTLDNNFGGSGNSCSSNDCSGAYGILVEITPAMYNTIISSGSAKIAFYYEWDDVSGNNFEDSDQVWVKARWTSPTTGQHYLGSTQDTGDDGADATFEIWTVEDANSDFSGNFEQDIASYIEGSGMYYFEIGGKILSSNNNEHGTWRFDNIQLKITNATDHYYFRKHFTISDINKVKKGVLNVLSDDVATVYLNGVKIDEDLSVQHLAKYWNRGGKNIDGSYFYSGDNVVAAELLNANASAKFDLALIGINDSRERDMLVMTDGQATTSCSEQGTTGDLDGDGSSNTDSDDAIQAACDAREKYGITVYAVGYSTEADEPTLAGIATCGDGLYTKSDNITGLQNFYQDVAASIISASRHSQTIEISGTGGIASSILYDDSYIKIDYNPITDPPQFGEISIIMEEKNFNNCTFNVYIPPDVRVSSAKLTSYSSEHWTDALSVNGNPVYNLTYFSSDYTPLGDPFIVNIPANYLSGGNNTFSIRTGDSPENFTGCSLNNTLIYTSQVQATVSYSDVLEKAVGCTWNIDFDDGGSTVINVPATYNGTSQCYYTSINHAYPNTNDTYDDAMFNLLDNLDFDDDGRIYVNIEESDLVVGAISVGKVPYPWGPAIAEVKVWR